MNTKIRFFPKKIIYFALYFGEKRMFLSLSCHSDAFFRIILNVVKNLNAQVDGIRSFASLRMKRVCNMENKRK